jgi:hypothetical protein
MFSGEYIFSHVMDHLPMHTFRKCIERYSGNRYVKSFNCFDQFLCMAFGQLTHRESLRDIEIKIARPLYSREDLVLAMKNTVYALDASTIDLCMSVFP